MEALPDATVLALLLIPLALLPFVIIAYAIYRTIRGRIRQSASVAPTQLRAQFDVTTGIGETISALLMALDSRLGGGGYVLADQTSNSLTWIRVLSAGSTIGVGGLDSRVFVGSAVRLPPNVRRVNVSVYERDGGGSRVTILGVGEPWMPVWLGQLEREASGAPALGDS